MNVNNVLKTEKHQTVIVSKVTLKSTENVKFVTTIVKIVMKPHSNVVNVMESEKANLIHHFSVNAQMVIMNHKPE